MPIYEYQCKLCSFRFEVKRSFEEKSPVLCPKCHGEANLIFSPTPVIFKGTGFYTTDNREKPQQESGKEEKEE